MVLWVWGVHTGCLFYLFAGFNPKVLGSLANILSRDFWRQQNQKGAGDVPKERKGIKKKRDHRQVPLIFVLVPSPSANWFSVIALWFFFLHWTPVLKPNTKWVLALSSRNPFLCELLNTGDISKCIRFLLVCLFFGFKLVLVYLQAKLT